MTDRERTILALVRQLTPKQKAALAAFAREEMAKKNRREEAEQDERP